jgi:hypothetical protein
MLWAVDGAALIPSTTALNDLSGPVQQPTQPGTTHEFPQQPGAADEEIQLCGVADRVAAVPAFSDRPDHPFGAG